MHSVIHCAVQVIFNVHRPWPVQRSGTDKCLGAKSRHFGIYCVTFQTSLLRAQICVYQSKKNVFLRMNSLNPALIHFVLLWDTKERWIFLNTYPTVSFAFQGKPAAHKWKQSTQGSCSQGHMSVALRFFRPQYLQFWDWVKGMSTHCKLKVTRWKRQTVGGL